jgi:hypothetical protein
MSLFDVAKATIQRANLFHSADKRATNITFKTCPLVWDTGASFGLTPFRGDFIDYTECSITINDIARTNQVVGVGTTLHKFQHEGRDIFIPCLSYHLPTANIRLFSPQTFHTIYGGHSTVNGDRVEQYIDHLRIRVDINNHGSNVPMVYGCHVSPQEMKEHGPHIRSALPSYQRKTDALGSFTEGLFQSWDLSTIPVDEEFDRLGSSFGYGLPGVGIPDNHNLSSAQKELLLWHWKLGVSMQRVQQLIELLSFVSPPVPSLQWIELSLPRSKRLPTVPSQCANLANSPVPAYANPKSQSPKLFPTMPASYPMTNTALATLSLWTSTS